MYTHGDKDAEAHTHTHVVHVQEFRKGKAFTIFLQ